MDKITNITIENSGPSSMKNVTMKYIQNGENKKCDLCPSVDSVVVTIFNTTRQVLIFVKQFRPAVYYNRISAEDHKDEIDLTKYPVESGILTELCSGKVDKKLSLEEVASKMVLEQCGYEVPLNQFIKVGAYRLNPEINGCTQTAFYCEVEDSMMKIDAGKSNSDVETVEYTIPDVKMFLNQTEIPSNASLMFNVLLFLYQKML